jgi:hypothetical protein
VEGEETAFHSFFLSLLAALEEKTLVKYFLTDKESCQFSECKCSSAGKAEKLWNAKR